MRPLGLAATLLVLALACSAPTRPVSARPPTTARSTVRANPSPPQSPSVDPLLVIRGQVYGEPNNSVRLARLDATDVASVPGTFVEIERDRVIVLNGDKLETLDRDGGVTVLGTARDAGTHLVVSPDLKQWLYSVVDGNETATIHLSSASTDRVLKVAPSPNQNGYFAPFAWNASGAYMQLVATGIGGWAPFINYEFPVYRIDLDTGALTRIEPLCRGWATLDDGTLLCSAIDSPSKEARLEIRPPGAATRSIDISSTDFGGYYHLSVSPSQREAILSRNASTGNTVNYSMAVVDISGDSWRPFGPIDFAPDFWLPDGRVVADHQCVVAQDSISKGACDPKVDGTYIIAADGGSSAFFYKLMDTDSVVGYLN